MPFDSLKLNGIFYSKPELLLLTNNKLKQRSIGAHESSLYSFIKEWLVSKGTIRLQTSGSTGKPKKIVVKREQMIASAQMTCKYFKLNKKSNLLLCISTNFIGGKMMVVRAFVSGANLITAEPDGNPLRQVNRKIDFAAMVPLQVENTLENVHAKKKFEQISDVIIGGAGIPYSLEEKIRKCKNNIYSTFAMTETLSHIALRKLSGKNNKGLYEVLSGVKIKLDKRGCLLVNAPMLNEKPIVTNDIVELIGKNQFKWLGRFDNVINSGGIKIHPEEIEEKLSAVIMGKRFFIASKPDEKLGQKAVLVLEGVKKSEIERIRDVVEKALSKYERPKEYLFIRKFKETSNGKIQREGTVKQLMNSK